jgi:3-oxoacyl-[acyl-carrier protein] reductase
MMTDARRTPEKAALIFGGSRGIGAAVARRLARDGFAVALTYVSRPDRAAELVAEIEAGGGRALAIEADSADPPAISAAVERAVERFEKIDAVVVNAGIIRIGAVDAFGVDDLDQMLAVNVRGVFLSIQAATARMREGGRVITIGSNTAVRSSFPGTSVYAMTKAAVATMVKGIAIDLAPRRITVNNIQPGPTETDMTAAMIPRLTEMSPLRRVGQPAEIAALVSYLASEEAGYMTGSSLTIDGGFVL